MPNIMNQELVRAFNIILCHNDIAITNLTVQSIDQAFSRKKDHIVISFDKNMDVGQCMEYLHNIKESIVETFCGSESGANMSFNTKFFPFNFNESQLTEDKEGYKFSVPIDKDIVLNLKCLLANGLARDVTGAMGRDHGLEYVEGHTSDKSFDRKSYLYCMQFYDKRLQDYFVKSFSSRVKDYKNSPKKTGDFLKIKDNCVYIKASIFDNVEFIKDIVKHKASLECRDFEVTSAEDETVESLKFPVIDLPRKLGIPINSVLHVSYTGSDENSVLIPATKEIIDNIIYYKVLSKEQADDINKVFGMTVLNNVEDCISPKHLPVSGNGGVYGIDFYDKDISYCVLNKIMESSVINKDHELSIDPELVRALSPAQSPFNSPTHAEPPRTPPKQRQEDRDSGYDSSSPPKPKDSVAHSPSGGPGPSTELSDMEWESPTQSRDEELEGSPRQGLEEVNMLLLGTRGVPGTSKGFSPSPQLNSIAVSYGVSGPSSSLQSVGAAQNVPAGTSARAQQPNRWSLPAPSAGLWSLPQSRPSSWKGANPVGANLWAQQTNPCLSQGSNVITPSIGCGIPMKSILLTTKNDPKSSSPEFSARSPGVEDVKSIFSVEPEKQQVTDKSVQGACGGSPKKPNFWREEWSRLSGKKSKESSPVSSPDGDGSIPGTNFPTNSGTAQQFVDAGKSELSVKPEYRKTPSRDSSLGLSPKLRGSAMHGSVQASTSSRAQKRCSSPAPSGDVPRSRPQPQVSSFVSEPSSSKGANEGMLAEMNALFPWLGTQSPQSPQLIESVPSCSFWQEPSQVFMVNESLSSGWKISNELPPSNKLNDKEKDEELIEALLYVFNLRNYTLNGVYTNFFAKDGKIVSLLDEIDRGKYFQAVEDYIIEKYFGDKKEAGKVCDLNEFPFKLSDSYYEDRQGKTVVANISGGAVSNLKILFSQKFKKDVDAIDISVVKEVEKHEKDEWVERQVSEGCSLKEACISCFPDEGALGKIPIAFEEGRYFLDRSYDDCEVRLLRKAQSQRAKGTSVAGKNKDSDTSGYESMDCENTGGKSPKRALELSVENLRISTKLDATKTEQQLSLTKKLRSN